MAGSGTSAAWNGSPRGSAEKKQISRYDPLLVTLHWVLAVLIIAELSLGFFGLAATRNSDPQKIGLLRVHMPGGVLIVALTVIGFIVRMRTSRPVEATTGYPLLERIAPISYYGLYILIVLIVGTGFATAVIAGLGEIVFGPSGVPLPDSMMIYPTFVAHVLFALLLVGFIILHVLAALYHQFVKKDGLLLRCPSGDVCQIPRLLSKQPPRPCEGMTAGFNPPRRGR